MEGLFGYIAVFILGIVFGAIFMKKTGAGDNGNSGGLFSRFGRNNNQGMPRPPQGNMMNQGMQRPPMGNMQRPPMMPGQPPMGQPPGSFGSNNNYPPNNGGW